MKNAKKTPMLMSWDADFSQHKEIIDEQHRAILTTINSIHYLLLKGEASDIVKDVWVVYSQLEIHFKTEMLILKQKESPLLSVYEKQAKEFLSALTDISDVNAHEHQTHILFEKFKQWWQSHLALHEEITPYLFDWTGDYCRVVA